MENKTCKNCNRDFTIFQEDTDFYIKFGVPSPDFCPECRLVRRLTFRNERALYKRACDLCGKDEILMFAPESPYKAYCFTCWWSDNWDGKTYGREYDFSKPFFEQFKELLLAVPRPGKIQQGNTVNSFYTNRVSDLKNSYLSFGCNMNEDLQYCAWTNNSKECVDCFNTQKSERCYECVDCIGSYNLTFSRECVECSGSSLLLNCRNCQDCFGCVNMRGKTNYIFNEPYSKEEYRVKIAELTKDTEAFIQACEQFKDLIKNTYVPWAMIHQAANSVGNWIDEAKNIFHGFNIRNVEEGRYIFALTEAKDVMDYCHWGVGSELIYEGISVGRQCANVKFANECWNQLRDSEYVMNCHNSHHLFGCIGIRNSEYCIFNKQYTKEEYEMLVPKIKEMMDTLPYKDGRGVEYRYGSFYPAELSPFAYNESIAQEYFPKNKIEALAFGARWHTVAARNYGITISSKDVPQKIELVSDTITKEIIGCANAGREETMCTTAFRITAEELSFYRKMKLPLPHFCPNCRHFTRLSQRTSMRLYSRTCACTQIEHGHETICPGTFETSYSPDSSYKVYCESCYQKEVV
jgi:hypothetical protein